MRQDSEVEAMEPLLLTHHVNSVGILPRTVPTLSRGSLSSPTPCGDVIECNVRIARAVELEPDMQHISLASHIFLRKVWLVAHV